jgi:hypothetical protein
VSNEINIFELGTLIQFETHYWQAVKRLPKGKLPDDVASKIDAEKAKNWIRSNKSLINSKHTKEIVSIINEARNIVASEALPFPIKGIYFLSKESVDSVNANLQELIEEKFNPAVEKFCNQYNDYITEAKDHLGSDLFDSKDYPISVKNKFSISWRFFDLTIPSGITEEARQQEMDRFHDLMSEAKAQAIMALRNGFAEIVTHLHDTLSSKLDGEKRRVRQSAIDNIHEFFKVFQNKNIFQDSELEGLIKQAKSIMDGVESTDLRDDQSLTKLIKEQLGEVKNELEQSTEKIKRKLYF